ncbi:MAG: type II toxin-antitoxin system RelE/ParE family toxin [Patulibacter sp.]
MRVSPPARRAIEQDLPEKVAAAAVEFIYGPLAENPHRLGKPLRGPLTGRWSARRGDYRVIYTIDHHIVTIDVLAITHRRDAYRP